MREVACPCCGQLKRVADPPALTVDQRRMFERQWDAGYNAWCESQRAGDPSWVPPVLETVRPGSPSYYGRRG